jgi:uncharacterized damage-inducible protein DinB
MKQHLLRYTQYNLWANNHMVQRFQNAGEAVIDAPVVSSFPSVRATFLHLWDVEVLWLERLRGMSPREFPSKHFAGTHADIFDGLLKASERFVEFVAKQPDDYFTQRITFNLITVSGSQEQSPVDMIHHCMNHQTLHRGQLITMGRQLGITSFPKTDFIIWAREAANVL